MNLSTIYLETPAFMDTSMIINMLHHHDASIKKIEENFKSMTDALTKLTNEVNAMRKGFTDEIKLMNDKVFIKKLFGAYYDGMLVGLPPTLEVLLFEKKCWKKDFTVSHISQKK